MCMTLIVVYLLLTSDLFQWLEASDFIQSVNMVLRAQEETERLRDAMSHIVGYTAVEIPNELKEVSIWRL